MVLSPPKQRHSGAGSTRGSEGSLYQERDVIIAIGRDGVGAYGVTTEKATEELDNMGGGLPILYIEAPDKLFVAPEVPTLKLGE